ncbi:hypothetical protein [Actinophytocola sediminis]
MPDVVAKEAVAQVEPAPDQTDSPHGTFEVILSAPVQDRDGETLHPDEWEPLPEHITFDIDHGMSVSSTVGSGRPELDEHGNLRVRGTYASTELAQTTRALVGERHIRTTSVAFLRKQDRKTGKPRRELLNGAFVAVPANTAALVLSSKAATTAGPDNTEPTAALRAQLADIDPAGLPTPVRDVLATLGVLDPDPAPTKPAADTTPGTGDTAADTARAALAVRARQLRALSALHESTR